MKEVYGSTWTLQLMVGFILLIMAFLTLMISFSRVSKVKNEVITIIEKYNGVNDNSLTIINSYLKSSGYNLTGRCSLDGDIKAISSLDDISLENPSSSNKYYYCIKKEQRINNDIGTLTPINYEVTLFYKFNIPILGNIATFTVKGKTTDMVDKDDVF